jgi:hypothetical protein
VDGPDRKRRSIDTQIDENLRKIFEEDVEQDLPDRLQRLLEALDGATSDSDDEDPEDESGSGGAGGADGGGVTGESGGWGGRADARQVAMSHASAGAPGPFALVARAGPG